MHGAEWELCNAELQGTFDGLLQQRELTTSTRPTKVDGLEGKRVTRHRLEPSHDKAKTFRRINGEFRIVQVKDHLTPVEV